MYVVHDGDAKDTVVSEIYATTEASYRKEVPLEEFREHLAEDRIVVARRDETIAGWLSLPATISERDDDEAASVPGVPVVLPIDQDDADLLAQLLEFAAVEAAPTGIVWHARKSELNQQVAEKTGAIAHRELFRIWQAPRERWSAPVALGGAIVHEIHAPLADDLLAKYAEFFTKAEISDCSGESCTMTWDAAKIAENLAEREDHLLTQILEQQGRFVAEACAFVWNDEMMIHITQHHAPTSGLVALIAALLQRIPAAHPDIRIATVELHDNERELLEPVLAKCGFEDKGPRTLYHLRPRDEAARAMG
ncbi:hypothetical protein BC374_24060 [Ensifer sp. LC13]|nr:hypothetical protein BC362_25255 [Ensifer sp. LC14]OCP06108.1 hypothetical protein BBX50_23835 [Ensifer sp. LC11]OCP07056.1 hypothetical protein BC374_24060 [Ensifer sp. LC13]OCP31490.1 hypothetical protein BC364_23595 [Ensifer sp. LC499]